MRKRLITTESDIFVPIYINSHFLGLKATFLATCAAIIGVQNGGEEREWSFGSLQQEKLERKERKEKKGKRKERKTKGKIKGNLESKSRAAKGRESRQPRTEREREQLPWKEEKVVEQAPCVAVSPRRCRRLDFQR